MKPDRFRLILILTLALLPGAPAGAQEREASGHQSDLLNRIEDLWAAGKWDAVVALAPASPEAPADIDYYRGMALARLQRWEAARAAFESGHRKSPRDPRFFLELAGVAYRQDRRGQARLFLKKALRLDADDAYGNDFLAGLYFLNGNLEAALKYWNRENKPQVRNLMLEPNLHVDPVLLDRAFAFAPQLQLTLAGLYTTRTLVESLGIFQSPRFELTPRDDGTFDLSFHGSERNGWGASRLDGLVSLLRDIPYRSLRPEFYNLRGSAWNSLSLLRWDPEKQRFSTSVSGPLGGNPRQRLLARLDARRERWDVGTSLRDGAAGPGIFELQILEAGAELQDLVRGRTCLRTAFTISHRRFSGTHVDNPRLGNLFTPGLLLRYEAGLHQDYSVPESRLEVSWDADARVGKVLAAEAGPFARAAGLVRWQWLPQARGNDYRLSGRVGAGFTAGPAPFDELFSLGLETDNSTYLRGHPGTAQGRKGAGPLGRRYFFLNCSLDKLIRGNGLWEWTAGPFADTGRAYAGGTPFGSPWLIDAGIVSRFTILGRFTVALSYGRSLRGNSRALFAQTATDDGKF